MMRSAPNKAGEGRRLSIYRYTHTLVVGPVDHRHRLFSPTISFFFPQSWRCADGRNCVPRPANQFGRSASASDPGIADMGRSDRGGGGGGNLRRATSVSKAVDGRQSTWNDGSPCRRSKPNVPLPYRAVSQKVDRHVGEAEAGLGLNTENEEGGGEEQK